MTRRYRFLLLPLVLASAAFLLGARPVAPHPPYERREVHVLGTDGGRAVLADGVAAGEPVVSRQAQVLLSEEFRGAVDND